MVVRIEHRQRRLRHVDESCALVDPHLRAVRIAHLARDPIFRATERSCFREAVSVLCSRAYRHRGAGASACKPPGKSSAMCTFTNTADACAPFVRNRASTLHQVAWPHHRRGCCGYAARPHTLQAASPRNAASTWRTHPHACATLVSGGSAKAQMASRLSLRRRGTIGEQASACTAVA